MVNGMKIIFTTKAQRTRRNYGDQTICLSRRRGNESEERRGETQISQIERKRKAAHVNRHSGLKDAEGEDGNEMGFNS